MAEDKYKTPQDMQEIYDRDRNIHEGRDKVIEESKGLEGQEKIDKLKEAAGTKLRGQEVMDNLISYIDTGMQKVVETASIDDPDSYWDDTARGALGTAQWIGNVASTPGISHALRVLDSPFWVARQSAGGALEHGLGVDPRYGHAAVGIGEFFVGGKALTKAGSLTRKFGKHVDTLMNPPPVYALSERIIKNIDNTSRRFDDLPAPYAAFKNTVKATPGEVKDLQTLMFKDSIIDSGDFAITTEKMLNITDNAYEALRTEWVNKVWKPVFNAYQAKTGTNLVNILATKPGFKYIEHKIAKGQKWYWELKGEDPNKLSNLRLLFNDRYKTLKDSLEGIIYGRERLDKPGQKFKGINDYIDNPNDRYIVDLELDVPPEMWIRMEDARPGNLVIRKAGSGEIVGAIGEYYQVLYSNRDQLIKGLIKKGIIDESWSITKQTEALREWRSGVLSDHLDIIRKKEANLKGLSETERLEKINKALIDDMAQFKYDFQNDIPFLSEGMWKNISSDMSKIEIEQLRFQQLKNNILNKGEASLTESIQTGKSAAKTLRNRKGPFGKVTKTEQFNPNNPQFKGD